MDASTTLSESDLASAIRHGELLLHYQPKLVVDDSCTYGGSWVVNPSGGLLSKGHPIGATGLAQCAELVWQLRGQADKRQVDNVSAALQHNLGLGGACVVALYKLP